MQFLSNWQINLANVPKYEEFNQDFTEQIDYALATIILESQDERISPESKEEFRKLVECIDPTTNTLRVKYAPRKGGLGRRYADCPAETYSDGRPNPNYQKYYSALIAMPRIIKNTIYHYQGWRDYDQVKGHPTILLELARRNNETLPAYEDYLKEGRFDEIVSILSKFYSGDLNNPLTKRDIKWLFNKTIYGGGFNRWIDDIQKGDPKSGDPPKEIINKDIKHPIYEAFFRDTQKLINLVYANNVALAEIVCDDLPDTAKNLWSRKNRVMSYFCGIIENEITYHAYQYSYINNICPRRKVSWGYDGYTIPPTPQYFEEIKYLNDLNKYILEKTGLTKVSIIRKEIDETEILQECIERRKSFTVKPVKNIEPTMEDGKIVYYDFRIRKLFNINNLIESNGDETKFSDLIYELNEKYLFLQNDTIYLYYETEWRSMDKKDAGILKHLIKEIIEIYIKVALDLINEALKASLHNDELLLKYKCKLSSIMSVNGLIKRNTYINNVFSLLKNRLCCKKMDFEFDVGPNNYYLIHFKNGVYDIKQKLFRPREITDYITMTLDYDYIPENQIDNKTKDDVFDFFKKVQPDEIQRSFTLSYLAYCLTANTSHQIFKMNIGYSGGNGKSTELSFHEKSFPLYTAKLDSRVFLKGFEKRHKHLIEMAKRPIRLAYCEELPSKALDNSFVKDFVDGNQMPVEVMFGTKVMVKIQAKLCSTSQFDPLFSSEGGINRRGIIQYYTSTFVEKDETDESKHEYKKDLHFLDKFNSAEYKNAYFHLLLQYVDKLSVPQINRDAFKEVVEEGDVLLANINKYAIVDKDMESRVHIDELKEVFHMISYKELANKLKLMGCVYKKDLYIKGTKLKGVWCGIQIKPEEIEKKELNNEGIAEHK